MKRKKLLFAMLCIASALGLRAQSDVTSTYITNADFSTTDGWTQSHSDGSYWALGNGLIGSYAVANSKTSTTDASHLETEYCFGMQCRWSTSYANFTQTKSSITLPAGVYTITYDVQNTNTSTTSATYENNFFVQIGDTKYVDTKTEWMSGNSDWTTHTIGFSIDEEVTKDFTISLGYGTGSNNYGSGSTPHLYVSHLMMTCAEFVNPTAITLDNTSWSMIPTAKKTLSVASYIPAEANHNLAITWSSSDGGVATVSSDGEVTAVAAGTATITATTANGKSATCDITVNAAPLVNGDYYVLNVSKGGYLGGANSWGTQASVINHGIPFTVTLANGAYTLDSHTYNSSSQHFLNGTYVDGNSTNLYITSLGSGKYSISTSEDSGFLTANDGDAVVANSAADASSELAQWKFVTKAELESALASATSGSPVDATFYIGDPDFSRNLIVQLIQNGQSTQNPGSETYPWSYNTVTNYHFKGGNNSNMCAETYRNNGGTITQTLTVLNGKYLVKCQGFYRVDEGSDKSYLTANDEKAELNIFNANDEGTAASMSGASTSFSEGLYQNELEVDVIDGTLTIGIQNAGGNWCCFDNFELYYYGPNIAGKSTEITLDAETEMTAGDWYYFDIPVNALYNLTTTNISDIVYTTDGTILIENESGVTETFSTGVNETLTAGRYYVKSASEQNLKVTVGAWAYEVGSPTFSTADGGYTQNNIFTVTFPSATTNDPDGATSFVASSTATVNGNTVDLVETTNGFTLDLGTLTANTDYVIAIPAGVYGYAGESMNAAINVTIHTPVALDGEYVLYDASAKLFLGRGCQWGTEASADKYGIPFNLVTDATGTSSIEFVDLTGVYFFITGTSIYTDNASTGWKLNPVAGGYTLSNADQTLYATHSTGVNGEHVHTTDVEASATVWTLMTKSERDAIIAAYPAENKSNVITAAGISTTAGDFETFLSNNYNAVDCTSAIGTATFASAAGDWTWTGTYRTEENHPKYGTNFVEVWNATGAFTQTIGKANLPAGIYKVTVQGFERRKGNDDSKALYAAGYHLVSSFLSANGEQVRFTDWNEVTGEPNNTGDAVTVFNNGEAVNTVYVYLDGDTDLELMVRKPNYIWNCWIIMNNFTLTRYIPAEPVSVTAAGYATYVSDNDLDFTDTTIKAYRAFTKGDGTGVNFAEVTTVPAGEGVLLYSAGGEFTEKVPITTGVSSWADDDNVFVRGTGAGVATDGGTTWNYILNNKGGNIGFYRANGQKVATNRAYISISKTESAEGIKEFFALPGMDDDADGISLTPALSEDEEAIYNLAGQRMSKVQKGINIVNGKKILY